MADSKKVRTSPKDFFLHLLAMVALYASAISFTTVVFQTINIWIPDVLEPSYYAEEGARNLIRTALSFLIVFFPVYLWTSWILRKSYEKDKEKRKIWIRKWLVYFTLFVAALVIIGTLIALINTFLEGEITLRFILKMLAVLFVTGSIFGYYLWDEKLYERK